MKPRICLCCGGEIEPFHLGNPNLCGDCINLSGEDLKFTAPAEEEILPPRIPPPAADGLKRRTSQTEESALLGFLDE